MGGIGVGDETVGGKKEKMEHKGRTWAHSETVWENLTEDFLLSSREVCQVLLMSISDVGAWRITSHMAIHVPFMKWHCLCQMLRGSQGLISNSSLDAGIRGMHLLTTS